jgi:hypothetical protein
MILTLMIWLLSSLISSRVVGWLNEFPLASLY